MIKEPIPPRRLSRLVLDIRQALLASRAVRSTDDLFTDNPFVALVRGCALSAMIERLHPDIVEYENWELQVYPRLDSDKGYGALVGIDVQPFLRYIFDPKHGSEVQQSLLQLIAWAELVSAGDPNSEYLEELSGKVARVFLTAIFEDMSGDLLSLSETGSTVLEIFSRGLRLNGVRFDTDDAADHYHSRKSAFMELAVMSATTHLYRRGQISFDKIGDYRCIEDDIVPVTDQDFFVKSSLSLSRCEIKWISPLMLIRCLALVWDRAEIHENFDFLLSEIDAMCGISDLKRITAEEEALAG